MDTDAFWYALPPERIAQRPIEPRDQAKLLVLNRKTGAWQDKHVFDLPDLIRPGDLLVFNDTKVFKARLKFEGGEILLLRPSDPPSLWLAIGRPAKKLRPGLRIVLQDGTRISVLERGDDGTLVLNFGIPANDVIALADRLGEMPLPPYIQMPSANDNDYQTIYAKHAGSVAAPTAGFHFTPKLFEKLETRGMKKAFVTLHVGLGTFRPIKTNTIEKHAMHEEWCFVPDETHEMIEETRGRGGRVIAVGTTTVRALESDGDGFTKLFITPGYTFKSVDGLLTNFHLPKSTLLVLVSAFAGRENVLRAYQHAIENDYRFYSFGDAMLII